MTCKPALRQGKLSTGTGTLHANLQVFGDARTLFLGKLPGTMVAYPTMDTTTPGVNPPEKGGGWVALNVWIEGRKQGGGLHEVDEAEVLAKGQIQYTASHRHELPAARANVSAAASCKNRRCQNARWEEESKHHLPAAGADRVVVRHIYVKHLRGEQKVGKRSATGRQRYAPAPFQPERTYPR